MGCLMSRKSANDDAVDANTPKQYSWSGREKRDHSHLMVENVKDEMIVRDPGQINGEQLIVSGCERCTICLFDHVNTISIDDCMDCTFFIGPVMGSVAVRNCCTCTIMSASQQFRARDCKMLNLFLFVSTQPAIESCSGLRIGCFSANYNGLQEQFAKAGLNIFNNNWSSVYDFTANDDNESHWTTFPVSVKAKEFLKRVPVSDALLNLSFRTTTSLVPQTTGMIALNGFSSLAGRNTSPRSPGHERFCLAFVYGSTQLEPKMERLLSEILVRHPDLSLVMAKRLSGDQANAKIKRIKFEANDNKTTTTTTRRSSKEMITKNSKDNQQIKIELLIVVVYQGRAAGHVLTENLERLFKSEKASVEYQIVSSEPMPGARPQQRSESLDNFNYLASIAFDNFLVAHDPGEQF